MSIGKPAKIDENLNIIPEINYLSEDKSLVALEVMKNELYSGTCDLHIQSYVSNGTDRIDTILEKVMGNNLHAFALTDHDTMEGVKIMEILIDKMMKLGVKVPHFIRGVEVISEYDDKNLHLLAYFPSGGIDVFADFLEQQRVIRYRRNQEMCRILQENKMDITMEELEKESAYIVGRQHAASIMLRKGYITAISEAFDKWLGPGCVGYVKYNVPHVKMTIASIREAGGVPVLAHPAFYGWMAPEELKTKIAGLKEIGLLGVEVVHGYTDSNSIKIVGKIVKDLDLLAISGSDYRGFNSPVVEMFNGSMDFSEYIS